MNTKKFLIFFLLVALLFTVVRAEDEIDESKEVDTVGDDVSENKGEEVVEKETEEVEPKDEPEVVEEPVEDKETGNDQKVEEPVKAEEPVAITKTTTIAPVKTEAPKPTTTVVKVTVPQPTTKPVDNKTGNGSSNGNKSGSGSSTSTPSVPSNSGTTQPVKVGTPASSSSSSPSNSSSNKTAPVSNSSSNTNTVKTAGAVNTANTAANTNTANVNTANTNTANANTANAAAGTAAGTAAGAVAANAAANQNATTGPTLNPIAPQTTGNTVTTNNSNVSADGNIQNKEESSGSGGVVKTTVISLVAVGAVVGVATVGVRAYNKKTSDNRGIDLADIEAQPINNDFGKSNDDLSGMAPEDYNPYNIMNDVPNEPYAINNPYEYKPSYDENVIDTTPFNKAENVQDNFMSRESIFSNSGNIPQIGNDVFNFGENAKLPYVQELPVENSYIEEPVANQIEVENYEMPNSQMPTLVPVQPEIVITQPDEEPAQEGYKQIVPTVAQMEIIETPDFNNMTTSMIEDHINNMDLEQLANTETEQQQTETDTGYKQIVPDIQEAVIENFDIDDDEEDQEFSAVDNITDTYRAALRATYCSTNDDNRFSYRTVDSDHSLLHTMREDGEW